MEQKQNDQNQQDVKGDFITIASHQLRTPIAGIRWSLDSLLSSRAGKLSDKQREIIQAAYQNNRFLARAVGDLLRASRVEQNELNYKPEYLDLEVLVGDILQHLEAFSKAFNCEVVFKPEKNLPKVFFDPLQLKPIIEGLIDNAIRYSNVEGRKAIVTVEIKKNENRIAFVISDRGIGIPEDQQPLVFSRFFRGRNAMKSQTEGLGLDLYIAKKVIELAGGQLSFTSIEGRGSTFFLYLPTKQIDLKARADNKDDAKETLQKEREFVNITVHELKAPLGMAKWSLEMLKAGKLGQLNSDQLELVNQVYRGNERLLVLVRDLLDLAKLQEGKFDVEPHSVNLKTIVDDAVTAFRAQAEKKKIIIEMPGLKGDWPMVMGDSSRISQVLTNLISNAIKYTPEGGKVGIDVVTVDGEQLKQIDQKTSTANINHTNNEKGYVIISVKDTGIGISENDQKKLFSRFFRSKNVMESKTEGTGLGLYITKTIVDLHQGDIWFTSQVGEGSIFYFSLPIA